MRHAFDKTSLCRPIYSNRSERADDASTVRTLRTHGHVDMYARSLREYLRATYAARPFYLQRVLKPGLNERDHTSTVCSVHRTE